MGVRRLQTFLEQHCPGGCYEVSIEEIASDFRLKEKREPVIVVDGSSCYRKLYGNLDWICGGQYKEFSDRVNDFIKKFSDLGITLVFFYDGATRESKRSTWISRRLETMNKAHAVFDALKAGCEVSKINRELFIIPPGTGHMMSSLSKAKCKAQRSIKECDEEIAAYAANHKCLAILAQDSDFVIYRDKAKFYLSVENLNLDRMTTLVYDRYALIRYLNINESDLPMLASLMGNDFISGDDLKPFHSRLTVSRRPYAAVLVPRIAEYIQSLPKGNDLFLYLGQLSMEVFRGPHRAEDFQKSILSYASKLKIDRMVFNHRCEKWNKILAVGHENYVQMESPSHIYNILRKLPFEMSTALEDHRISMPPSAIALRPLRQRIYGIALCEYPQRSEDDLIVEEWCMSGDPFMKSATKVSAVLPPKEGPHLLDLWEGESDDVLTKAKFKLMAWVCSRHLLTIDLDNLPPQILPATCILSYLYHDAGVLKHWEVKVFAAVVVDVQAMEPQELSPLQVKHVKVRGVQLAALFNRAVTHLSLANAICGKPIREEWTKHHQNFDGKLFQIAYMKGEDPTPTKGSLQHFKQMCAIILN